MGALARVDEFGEVALGHAETLFFEEVQKIDDVIRSALLQNQPFDFALFFTCLSARLRSVVRIPPQSHFLQLNAETLPLFVEEVNDLRLHQTLSAAFRRCLSHQSVQKALRYSFGDCRQLFDQSVLRTVKAVNFSVKVTFEGEGEFSRGGLGLGEGKGSAFIEGGKAEAFEDGEQSVGVGIVALSREGPFRTVAQTHIDSVLTLAHARKLIFRHVTVRHDRAVETRLFVVLRRHFVHSFVAEIAAKVFVFDAAFVVLRCFAFVVRPFISTEPRFGNEKTVEFESAFVDENGSVIRFKGAGFFAHALSAEGFAQL